MKTSKIVEAFKILNAAKLTKMEDADKFKAVKAIRKMKKVAEEYDEFVNTAREKLKGEDFEEMSRRADEWNRAHGGQKMSEISDEEKLEYATLDKYLEEYWKKVNDCCKEEQDKEIDLEIEKLSMDAFGKLMASNDWECGQIIDLSDVLCECQE